ncbi:hypothetical protein ACFVXC_10320 [Streptomyces sp. NPDC058257]|uniref:hypothetical protein n=1 Tax=Streptomyces sp. NPDC058257 TaxID=3346409 RepID=UPI0036EE6F5D
MTAPTGDVPQRGVIAAELTGSSACLAISGAEKAAGTVPPDLTPVGPAASCRGITPA